MANAVKKYRVKVLTPVHIGTGEELQENLDFYVKNNQVRVLDFDRLMTACEQAGIDPMPYVEKGRLDNLFTSSAVSQPKPNIDPRWAKLAALQTGNQVQKQLEPDDGLAYQAQIQAVNRPQNILSQIKTASSLGYIPGSSVKGAIRTVLARHLMNDNAVRSQVARQLSTQGREAWQRRAGQDMEKRLFGRNPNYDLGRVIQVTDVGPGARVQVIEILIADMDRNGQLRWKNLRNHRIASDPRQGTSIFCECLPVGTELLTEIRIDQWLLEHQELGFNAHRDPILQFESLCRAQAKAHLERETMFFRKGGLNDLSSFSEKQLLPLAEKNSGFVLRVGWGTGWEDKTAGDNLDTSLKENLRRWYELGKMVHKGCYGDVNWWRGSYSCKRCRKRGLSVSQIDLVSPFPKTRKIAFANQRPAYPMGWLAFEAIS